MVAHGRFGELEKWRPVVLERPPTFRILRSKILGKNS